MVSIIFVAVLSLALGYCIHKYIVPIFKKEVEVVKEDVSEVSKYVQTDIVAVKEDIKKVEDVASSDLQKAKEEVKTIESKI